MVKLRERVNTSSYINSRYFYSGLYILVNNKNRRHTIYYKQKRGSPAINTLVLAARWPSLIIAKYYSLQAYELAP